MSVELALIPPYSLMEFIRKTKYQLLLPEHLEEPAYWAAVEELWDDNDNFIILDNGAVDGGLCDWKELCKHANDVMADEVVLPDVPGNSEETWYAVRAALRKSDLLGTNTRLMGVVQGKDFMEVYELIGRYEKCRDIRTIGIPRDLIGRFGIKRVRLEIAMAVAQHLPGRFDVHFLGGSPSWPQELRAAAQYGIGIRSFDTSLPFNYAYHGVSVLGLTRDIKRPDGYFKMPSEAFNHMLLHANVEVMLAWAAQESVNNA